jgi:hypothetical protein
MTRLKYRTFPLEKPAFPTFCQFPSAGNDLYRGCCAKEITWRKTRIMKNRFFKMLYYLKSGVSFKMNGKNIK